ncbi:phosphatidylglycerophosphate synthase 1 isoform X2 [Arctopsyche grandis]
MWRRFTSTIADLQQQPIIFPESISPYKATISKLAFRRKELEIFNWFFSVTPCYPVQASKITIINGPKEFYDTLTKKCQSATNRIVLASLYLGTGSLEKKLVSAIKHNTHFSQGKLKLNVLLDFQRGSRGVINSKTMLASLLENSNDLCRISLYHTPHLRGLYKQWIPQRWNELIELQHMKVYLADNTVIISGANLSNDYFTNRQDRYVMIEDKRLADFYANLVSVVQSLSFQLQKDGSVMMEQGSCNPCLDDVKLFIDNASRKIQQYFDNAVFNQQNEGQEYIDSTDTWVMPLIQAGGLGIRIDSEVTRYLLASAPPLSNIKIATGYFNLTNEYTEAIIKECQGDCSLLMAHPNANGFKGAKGPAGGVPDAYSLLAQKFYNNVESFGQQDRITLHEYEKPGWTFHGKGLWYYLPGESLPSLTFIGSPNFGERSVNRDLETQVAIITADEDLKKRLHEENVMLYENGRESIQELFGRKIPNWVKLTVGVFRNFF